VPRSLSRSPSSPPPSITQSPFPPRSLVRAGQNSPHKPLLVVSHSTCPPLYPSPLANSFIIGTAVINNNPGGTCSLNSAARPGPISCTCPPLSSPPHGHNIVLGTAVINYNNISSKFLHSGLVESLFWVRRRRGFIHIDKKRDLGCGERERANQKTF
jgi:hypothetical protein